MNSISFQHLVGIIAIIGVIINALVAYYIYRQVKVAKMISQRNVMPVLGIMVEESEASRITSESAIGFSESKALKYPKYYPVSYLVVYVQFAIAKDINCEILKNGRPFTKIERNSAVPRGDKRLPIYREDISKDVEVLSNEEKIEFIANFTYKSVLDDNYSCQYVLTTGKYLGDQDADLRFVERPWD